MSAFSPPLSDQPASPQSPAGAPSPARHAAKPATPVVDPEWQNASTENPWTIAGVVALHVVLIGWLAYAMNKPAPVTPPALIGMLVAPEPIVEAQPLPIVDQPKPVPRPAPRPKPVMPVPVAAPSERAVSAPPPEPVAPPSPEPVAVAPAPPAPPAPAPAPAAPEPVTPPYTDVSQLNTPASYPSLSKRLGEQGKVLLDVYIRADGTVGEVKLKRSSGYPRLDQSAQDAVRSWRYHPARRGNEAVPAWREQPVTFSLDG